MYWRRSTEGSREDSAMIRSESTRSFPRFGDVAHVGHVELFTPQPEASLSFFTSVVGLHETGRSGDSVYLRAWGDYEWHTLKLTAHSTSGICLLYTSDAADERSSV